jgi:hypothetical protein
MLDSVNYYVDSSEYYVRKNLVLYTVHLAISGGEFVEAAIDWILALMGRQEMCTVTVG